MSEIKSTWDTLAVINVNHKTKEKNGLTYLSWAWAWGMVKQACPDANYKVINYDGKPWIFDHTLGYMVQTEVTIKGETIPMHLFVMDGANKAQRCEDYEYEVKNWKDPSKPTVKKCKAASMFDINTTIMRCLTKNLAMFGLGHYIYAGEDLPQVEIIGHDQISELEKLIKDTGTDLQTMLDYYKVPSLKEMYVTTFNHCKSSLEGKLK